MDCLIFDVRSAFRSLGKNPGFAAIAILALALGIGATTAIFSVVNGVLLRPLPFPDPGRIGVLSTFTARDAAGAFSPADYLDVARDIKSYVHVAAYRDDVGDLGADSGEPERVMTQQVTHAFFDVLGVAPAQGRLFHVADAGERRLAVISHGLWTRRFAADPATVGRSIRVGGTSYVVAGVLRDGQGWPAAADLWLLAGDVPPSPIGFEGELRDQRQLHYFSVFARLKPGVTETRAAQDLEALAATLQQRFPDSNSGRGFRAVPITDHLVGDVRRALLVLLASVAFVLLIACANVAGLLLARATARQREVSIRLALGATRSRLVGQLLTESLLLALAGGALGLLGALWGVRVLVKLAPENLPRLAEVGVDLRVAAFALMAALITGLLFGVVPAFQASQVSVVDALKESGRVSGGRRTRATRRLLVVGEVAVALVLLVGAGLMIRSFARLMSVDTGFRTEQIVALNVGLPQSRYPDSATQARFYGQVLERLSVNPQVQSAAVVFPMPMGEQEGSASFRIEGRDAVPRHEKPVAVLAALSPDFFRTLSIPILRGRDVTAQDVEKSPLVLLISAAAQRKYWPNEDPVGKRISLSDDDDEWFTVIGIVADVRLKALKQEAKPTIYLSFQQFTLPFMSFVMRTPADATTMTQALRAAVREQDKDLPVDAAKPLAQIVSDSAAEPRFRATLVGAFAAVALLLAAIGLYGVISQTVAQRMREMGIRLALGGTRRHIVGIVVRDGVVLTLIGVAVGLALAFAITRAISTLLFDVTASDPVTFAGVAALLLVMAAVASYLPARRAMRVDPMTALRVE